jgi:hypothetical protein
MARRSTWKHDMPAARAGFQVAWSSRLDGAKPVFDGAGSGMNIRLPS